MTLRTATPLDKNKILILLDELGDSLNQMEGVNAPKSTESQQEGGTVFDKLINRDDVKIFIAEEAGQILGLISLYILLDLRHGTTRGQIENVIVSKHARRKGVGSQIFAQLKHYCQSRNIHVIKLNTDIDNTVAQQFYEKNGGRYTEKMYRFEL